MAPLRIASLIVLPALLAGLLQGATPQPRGGAARPLYSGTLTYTASTQFYRINPPGPYAYANDAYGGQPLVDSPLTLDEHGRYFADLATAVPSVGNGGIRVVNGDEVVTIHLKPDQRWSDGSPITPADYIGALLLDYSPPIGGICPGPIKTATASTAALTLTFAGIYAPALDGCIPAPMPIEYFQHKYGVRLPAELLAAFSATGASQIYASPAYPGSALARLIQRWGQDPYNAVGDVFSGPYVPAQPIADYLEVLVPNRYYTALPPDPNHPRPAQLRFVSLPGDLLADVTAPGARTYDSANFFDITYWPVNLQRPLARAGYRMMLELYPNISHLELNVARPALRDVRVRRALAYAIDREAYLRALYPQLTAGQRDTMLLAAPIPSTSSWSINSLLPRNPYDPAKARALLAAAGYATSPGGPGRHLHLDFVTTGRASRVAGGRTLQRLLAPFGITLRLRFIPLNSPTGLSASYNQGGVLARGQFDIAEFSYTPSVEPAQALLGAFDPGQIPDANNPGGSNYTRERDVPLLQLLTQAIHTLDDAARYQLYAQAQRRIVENVYWIPLFSTLSLIALRPSFGNYRGGYFDDQWNAFEWYRDAAH